MGKQPHPFDPRKAAMLDDPERERWLPSSALVELIGLHEPGRVLDYGTGTARYAIAIAASYPQAAVVAYDVQEPMLEIARARARERAVSNLTVAGPEPESLAGPFDRILATNVLHEVGVEDLQRIHALLAPSGFAVFVDWDAELPRDVGPPADHTYTRAEALDVLERAGFSAEFLADTRFPYHFVIRARLA